MFTEEAELSRDEAKELHDYFKQHRANETAEDKIMLQEDNLARKKFLEVFPKVKAEIESCIQKLRALAERVDKVHKDCTISNVVTSSVGAFSGVLSIFGLLLAPFTAGSSLLLSAAGSGLGAATAVSDITTTAIEHSDTSSAEAEAQSILSASEDNMKILLEAESEPLFKYIIKRVTFRRNMKAMVSNIIALRRALADPALARDAMRFTSTGGLSARRTQQVKRAFQCTALSMTKTARLGAAGVRSLFLGLDVYNIVKDSQHLQEGAKAPLAEELRRKAQELEEELEELNQVLALCS
ncbi:apolipoprotein L3-like [Octodon degus]|uniref:Apolipoprotein L3-like n=1 Tax=Octodon degus TaxID=10160 RepID=A0A6P3EYM3_OCTDE|nr:apolipoprotein L3-like [Octodon degus]